jgi:hypothetical protein
MIRYPVPTMAVASPDSSPLLLILWSLAGLLASTALLSGSEVDFLLYW